jgi:hypothetical protein
MKTLTSKKELSEVIKGRTIYVWTGKGFIHVTKKALLEFMYGKDKINITYEQGDSFVRLGIN